MIRRGEVWWIDSPPPSGRRPGVVVQSNNFSDSRLGTVIAVMLTTNLALADERGNVRLKRGMGGLRDHSVANVTQVHTVLKTQLLDRLGMLPPPVMQKIDDGLRLVLALRGT